MFSLLVLCLAALATAGFASPARTERRSISQSLMDDLERYIQFASGADQPFCLSPLGTTLVATFNESSTDTQGFIARDDTRKEIIVSYRGTSELQDIITDLEFALVDYSSPGVTGTEGVQAHQGFLLAFNSVASTVIFTVNAQLAAHPSYSLISTGHSLGGALASLGGVSLAANFPNVPLRMFTFGQPRTGNSAYASLAENLVGVDKIFRGVETDDPVAKLPPQSWGYEHHATQYWVSHDPNTDPNNVVTCIGREDPNCSNSTPLNFNTDAHVRYFGQIVGQNSSICE